MTDPLSRLRADFLARCASDLADLENLAPQDPEVRQIIHRLAGAAGSFGFPELGALAAQFEEQAREGQVSEASLEVFRQALASPS